MFFFFYINLNLFCLFILIEKRRIIKLCSGEKDFASSRFAEKLIERRRKK